jgi:hypothetical protein
MHGSKRRPSAATPKRVKAAKVGQEEPLLTLRALAADPTNHLSLLPRELLGDVVVRLAASGQSFAHPGFVDKEFILNAREKLPKDGQGGVLGTMRCAVCKRRAWVTEAPGTAFEKYPRGYCRACLSDRLLSRAGTSAVETRNFECFLADYVGNHAAQAVRKWKNIDWYGLHLRCWECGVKLALQWVPPENEARVTPRAAVRNVSARVFCGECTTRWLLSSDSCNFCKKPDRSLTLLRRFHLRCCRACIEQLATEHIESTLGPICPEGVREGERK